MNKSMIRQQMLHLRNTLVPSFVEETGRAAGGMIAALQIFRKARSVMLYRDFRNETSTGPLFSYCLKTGEKVVLPLTDKNFLIHPYYVEREDQLSVSSLGISEPNPEKCAVCPPEEIGLVIVPGVAFDVAGHRLGYGKGCYDRFIPQLSPNVPLIGLAYDFQILPQIPADPHDVLMDAIATEKGLLPIAHAKHPIE